MIQEGSSPSGASMRRSVSVKRNLRFGPFAEASAPTNGRRETGAKDGLAKWPELPFPLPRKKVCFCGEGIPVKTAPAFGAPKGSLERYPLPANHRGCGEWERTHTGAEPFGIQLVVSYGWSLSA